MKEEVKEGIKSEGMMLKEEVKKIKNSRSKRETGRGKRRK